MPNTKRPELLAPAGDRERLEAALRSGADAVYLGGTEFGMRAAPENFDGEGLREAVSLCHEKGVRVYLTVNTLPRNDELERLPAFLKSAEEASVDALIIADLGVLELAQQYAPSVPVHVSTQAGVVNYATANALYKMGAKRIVLAREVSLKEIREIREHIPEELELEAFVHGAMCMSFSGRCLLSNYLTGRDGSRGECAQPCRWRYHFLEEQRPGQYFELTEEESGTYLFNSRDLCMIDHIPELVEAGVDSFKIEGRAKSAFYVGAVTNAYRAAIDGYLNHPSSDYVPEDWILAEMDKVSHRDYCTGFFFDDPSDNAQIMEEGGYIRHWDVMAEILGVEKTDEGTFLTVRQRNRFFEDTSFEVLSPGVPPYPVQAKALWNEAGERVPNAPNPMAVIRMRVEGDVPDEIPDGSILRSEIEQNKS